MKKNYISRILVLLLTMAFFCHVNAQDIHLPAPVKEGGKPLMQALNERQTTRTFTEESLSLQQLSDLLWAAWGYNRPSEKKRTAPSAMNYQEIDIYVTLQTGLYVYDAENNRLKQVHGKDIRSLTGTQDFVAKAPVNLVYVADMGKARKKEGDKIADSDLFWSYANCGFIAQNVYLYCASSGLGCVVRGLVPKDKLAPEMGLRSNQVILLAQTVGVPQK
ncbi:MAG: SagB/ThcOx family dehydrogenase [Bacteroidales bacterium]